MTSGLLESTSAERLGRRSENRPIPWLFSPAVDLVTFGGTAVVALGLVLLGWRLGWLDRDTPEWTWVAGVLLVDVAHVYATAFVVYFDPAELKRRLALYLLTPVLAFGIGAAIHAFDPRAFWRALAYLAVFHFVRQQYGWVALYRRKGGERDRFGWWVDSAAIYLATIFPLAWWHAHLPRKFWWFLPGDFASLPAVAAAWLEPLFWFSLAVYFARSFVRGLRDGFWSPGKDMVVLTTAACWYVGIVALDSDFAFTTTNVLIHGIPYITLVVWRRSERNAKRSAEPSPVGTTADTEPRGRLSHRARMVVVVLATVWVLAYVEELLWDRAVWHERGWLFGAGWDVEGWQAVVVPLLAVPQITHYVLDGFLWRGRRSDAISQP